MNYNRSEFQASYGLSSQLPESDRPEFVFSGRSNVGKSSLINRLCNRKNLARVSATPGKTATINFYRVDTAYFVDLPGYGYAKVSNADRERWDELINSYFEADRALNVLVQLLDSRHAPSADDVVIGIESGNRGADGPVQVQLQKVLAQQHGVGQRQAKGIGFVPQDAEHLFRNVNADHIVPSLGQHQGQLAGAAAEICHNAILDAVGFQFPGHIGE